MFENERFFNTFILRIAIERKHIARLTDVEACDLSKEENQETKLQTPVASVVQELVTSKTPEPSSTTPTQEVSTTKASSVLQEVTTSKPESVDEVSDKSSQLIKYSRYARQNEFIIITLQSKQGAKGQP